ncbi:MAG: hypothetical protein VKJ04_02040 [Vampirovibrionales bacterium]|nr:hypothetical protein [Vampirovibrionales bacterium]
MALQAFPFHTRRLLLTSTLLMTGLFILLPHAMAFGGKKAVVTPLLSLHGNMSSANTFEAANMVAQSNEGKSVSIEKRPLTVVARDEQTFNRLWKIFSSSILASAPMAKPKLDFKTQGAVFILPYESRGGGNPPSLRQIEFNPKKRQLLIEFDEFDLFSKNKPSATQAVTSVMGNPWYFAVFPAEQLEAPPLIRIRDW